MEMSTGVSLPRTAQSLLPGRSILHILPTGLHLMLTPYTGSMGAVYCEFAVNFLFITKQNYDSYIQIIRCLIFFSSQ